MNREQRQRLQQMAYEVINNLPKPEIEEVEIPKKTIDKLNELRETYHKLVDKKRQVAAEYEKLAVETYAGNSWPHVDGIDPFMIKVKRYVKESRERCARIEADVRAEYKKFQDDMIFSSAPDWRKFLAAFNEKIKAIKES